jgi:hypothetical protein
MRPLIIGTAEAFPESVHLIGSWWIEFLLIACKVPFLHIVGNVFNHILIWRGLGTLSANGEFEFSVLRHMYAF